MDLLLSPTTKHSNVYLSSYAPIKVKKKKASKVHSLHVCVNVCCISVFPIHNHIYIICFYTYLHTFMFVNMCQRVSAGVLMCMK